MKLYVLQSGILKGDKGDYVAGGAGTPFDVPVPYFLIEHESGYVLFDSGHNEAIIRDPRGTLGDEMVEAFTPVIAKEDFVIHALARLGVKPEEIVYQLCSHLHFDHCGGIGLFPHAKVVIQRAELHYAYQPDPFMKSSYLREDFDKDVDWLILDGWQDNKYDLFDDGKIIIYYTPGHTPGHQSVLVNLEESPPMMLMADACYTMENLDGMKLSGWACDHLAYLKNLMVFKDLQKKGVKMVPGHDPETWPSIKKAPEFYTPSISEKQAPYNTFR